MIKIEIHTTLRVVEKPTTIMSSVRTYLALSGIISLHYAIFQQHVDNKYCLFYITAWGREIIINQNTCSSRPWYHDLLPPNKYLVSFIVDNEVHYNSIPVVSIKLTGANPNTDTSYMLPANSGFLYLTLKLQ